MTAQDSRAGGQPRRDTASVTVTYLDSDQPDPATTRPSTTRPSTSGLGRPTLRIGAIALAVILASAGTLVVARLVVGGGPHWTTPATTLDAHAVGSASGTADVVPGSSRLALLGPLSILDNRATDALAAGALVTLPVLPPRSNAALLEVSMVDATGPGAVTLESSAGQVTALRLPKAKAQMSTVVVVVVGADGVLKLRTEGGGRLVVNLIGVFEPSASSTSGRIVAVPPTRALLLTPKSDGKNAVIDLATVDALRQARTFSAVVVHITADVGPDGGFVALGPSADNLNQVVYWTATAGDDRIRDGLLILPVAGGSVHLHYEAGTQLAADVIGYVTDGAAPSATVGLMVAVPPTAAEPVTVAAGRPTDITLGGLGDVPASRVDGVLLTATATGDTPGAVTVYPPGTQKPPAATLHAANGAPRPTPTLVTAVNGAVTVASEVPAAVTLTAQVLILGD